MRELSVREMRAGYGAIAEALEVEGQLVLTHHGKPFAQIVPLTDDMKIAASEAERRRRSKVWADERRKDLATMPMLSPFDWDSFRADR